MNDLETRETETITGSVNRKEKEGKRMNEKMKNDRAIEDSILDIYNASILYKCG